MRDPLTINSIRWNQFLAIKLHMVTRDVTISNKLGLSLPYYLVILLKLPSYILKTSTVLGFQTTPQMALIDFGILKVV